MQHNTICATCDAPLYRAPSKLRKHTLNFCNHICRDHRSIVWIGFIHSNCKSMSVKQVADHIGIPSGTLRTWLRQFRSWGLKIYFKPGPVVPNGIGCRDRVKIARAATRLARQKSKPAPVVKEKKVKVPKVRKPSATGPSNHGKPPKKDPALYKTKLVPFDASKHTMIKIDNRTWKQVDKKTA